MIGFLRGKLIHKAPPQLLLDVHGVGYEVEAPMNTFYDLPALGEEVRLHTHLIVREDAHILFGFVSEGERSLFRALIKVNGIGPKLALTILSGQTTEAFYRCIDDNDVKALVRLPGVGQKTAERLIVEMRGRLPDLNKFSARDSGGGQTYVAKESAKQEAISALCALGYKPQDAARMAQAVAGDDSSCEDIIRAALRGAVK
ncbi:Holliday junction branch migration protein RuvA [Methylomonas sp. HW2-6]|uniref:Holliday junction branch migration protein RuvA n=1 Tax=Methylomonas sp. HW2-6 TaxID=3376687 RepID=UPI0040412922